MPFSPSGFLAQWEKFDCQYAYSNSTSLVCKLHVNIWVNSRLGTLHVMRWTAASCYGGSLNGEVSDEVSGEVSERKGDQATSGKLAYLR